MLVFCRGGSRRRQSDKDMAQQPGGAGPAVGELWNFVLKQSSVASVYTKMKPLPADGNLSSLLSKAKLFNFLALQVLAGFSAVSASPVGSHIMRVPSAASGGSTGCAAAETSALPHWCILSAHSSAILPQDTSSLPQTRPTRAVCDHPVCNRQR